MMAREYEVCNMPSRGSISSSLLPVASDLRTEILMTDEDHRYNTL